MSRRARTNCATLQLRHIPPYAGFDLAAPERFAVRDRPTDQGSAMTAVAAGVKGCPL